MLREDNSKCTWNLKTERISFSSLDSLSFITGFFCEITHAIDLTAVTDRTLHLIWIINFQANIEAPPVEHSLHYGFDDSELEPSIEEKEEESGQAPAGMWANQKAVLQANQSSGLTLKLDGDKNTRN